MRRNRELALFDDDFEMRRHAEVTLRLQQISTMLIGDGTNGALYEHVLDAAIDFMSADMGSMEVFHPERGELRLLAERGFHLQSVAYWEWVRLNSGSTCGMALAAGCRVVVRDIEACEAMVGTADLDAYRRSGIRAVHSTPLIARSGRLLGMISTHSRKPHHPTERELQPLDVLARQAADLIERNEVEAALRESREQFRWLASIVEFSDDAIIGTNLDAITTSWNKGAERLFGYLAEETIGKPVAILIPPEHKHEEYAILNRIRRGNRVDYFETVRQRKDGTLIEISLTVSPIRGADGSVVGASGISRDITERKRSEAQLSALAREAEDGQLVLRWRELGGPPVKPPTCKGFGTHVMEAMIRGHVGGDVRLDWHAKGLVSRVRNHPSGAGSSERASSLTRAGQAWPQRAFAASRSSARSSLRAHNHRTVDASLDHCFHNDAAEPAPLAQTRAAPRARRRRRVLGWASN
jgi:PAS domain S-box-containing protein